MAHFAELDENNLVLQVIVVNNNELIDESGNESEQKGIEFCKSIYGENTNWIQTSYNASFRKNYAGPDMYYDSSRNAFLSSKPFPSWTLNEDTCNWEAPVLRPGGLYHWVEETQEWIPDEV
jgi:hypothetical protein